VPVTAKLSKLFYQRFGDQIVDELVDWFNSVDATYSANLRDLNDANVARFTATLNQRFAEQDAKFEKRFAEQDAKFEKRFAEQDGRLEKRFAEVDAKFEKLDAKIDRVAAELREFMERTLKDQTRWMFVAWASLLIPIIGLWMRP
jgi:molecular chaperone GrpE (heat shock protein)